MCDRGKGESFSERSKEWRSARKISRYARNDGMVYIALCEKAEKEKALAKGARNDGVQEGFFAVPLMTAWGNGSIPRSVQRICLESAIPVSSSRAKPSLSFIPPVPYPPLRGTFPSRGRLFILAVMPPPSFLISDFLEPWTLNPEPSMPSIHWFSIAHHAFLIIIYFSNLEYFRWSESRRDAEKSRGKCIALYGLINSRLCKFRNSINSYVNAKRKWK